MKRTRIAQIFLLILLVNNILAVKTVAIEYDLSVAENDSFIWEVSNLDSEEYERQLGEEPSFATGTQRKYKITEIDEQNSKWKMKYDVWDWTKDTDKFTEDADKARTRSIYKDPEDLADSILNMSEIINLWVVPTPFINYLEEFRDNFDIEVINVYISGSSLTVKYAFSHIEYQVEVTYTNDGVAEEITYEDSSGEAFAKIILHRELIEEYYIYIAFFLILGIVSIVIIIYFHKRKIPNEGEEMVEEKIIKGRPKPEQPVEKRKLKRKKIVDYE